MQIQGKARLRPVAQPIKSVAIVGFGKSRELAFNLPPDVPIWSLSDAPDYDFPRLDMVFEMHPERDLVLEGERYQRLKTEVPYPVMMLEKNDDFPSSVEYPLELAKETIFKHIFLGENHAEYFDSSMPYMVALAILSGYRRVFVYGFELRTDTEYRYQRVGAMLLIGVAAGMGIDIILPENTALIPPTLYGYDDFQHINRQDMFELHAELFEMREVYVVDLNAALDNDDLEKSGLLAKRVAQSEGGMHVLKGLIETCNEKKAKSDGDLDDSFFTISRQNLEQTQHEMANQESDWMGRLNVAHTKVVERKAAGADTTKAEQKREEAFTHMYKRAGAVHIIRFLIEKLDRSHAEMLPFDDPFFQYQSEKEKT